MGIELRRFDIVNDGINEQRELFSTCFPETNGTWSAGTGYHSWKFLSADCLEIDNPSYEYGAWIDEELVGYYGVIPIQYRIGESVCTAGLVCDVMTDPNQQGKGIFTALGKYATDDLVEQNIDFTTGYPIRPEVLPGHLRVGWRVAFELPIYILPVGVRSVLGKFRLPAILRFLFFVPLFLVKLVSNWTAKSEYSVETCSSKTLLEEDSQEFYRKWEDEQINFLVRSTKFLTWRLGASDRHYEVALAHDGREIAAIAIVSQTTYNGIRVLAILDICVLKGRERAGAALGVYCRDKCIEKNLDAAVVMAAPTTFRKSGLSKALFFKVPIKFKLIVKSLYSKATWTDLLREENWHITWLDTDNL